MQLCTNILHHLWFFRIFLIFQEQIFCKTIHEVIFFDSKEENSWWKAVFLIRTTALCTFNRHFWFVKHTQCRCFLKERSKLPSGQKPVQSPQNNSRRTLQERCCRLWTSFFPLAWKQERSFGTFREEIFANHLLENYVFRPRKKISLMKCFFWISWIIHDFQGRIQRKSNVCGEVLISLNFFEILWD